MKHFCRFIIKFGLSILEIFKDSQFNKTKIKHSKIQLQNQTQTLRKCGTSLRKGFFSAKVSDTFLSKRFSKGFVRSRVSLMFLIDTRKGRKSSRSNKTINLEKLVQQESLLVTPLVSSNVVQGDNEDECATIHRTCEEVVTTRAECYNMLSRSAIEKVT